MTTINKPLFSQPAVGTSETHDISDHNRSEGQEYQRLSDNADEAFAEVRLRVPLYLIAAAALLG